MKCEYCENDLPVGTTKCFACGAPAPQNVAQPAPSVDSSLRQDAQAPVQQVVYVAQPTAVSSSSRVAYILLALFLGSFGIHNFYAGYTSRGVVQLLLTLLLFWTIIVPCIVFVWIVIEMITVSKDSNGLPMS